MSEPVSNIAPMSVVAQHERRSPEAGLIVTIAALGVYVILRLWDVTQYSLGGGEIYLLVGARMDWGPMVAYAVADMVHPPLSYILFKWWIAVGGESLLWLKLFAVLPSVAAVVPLMLMCRELRLSRFATNLILLLAAVNGYLIHYAQEIRMYSLFMFLAVCSGWLFVRYCNAARPARKELAALTAVQLLMIYTHYFGWLLVGVEAVFLLIWHRKRLLPFAASVALLVALFAPWAYLVLQEYAREGSRTPFGFIPRPRPYLVAYLYATFNGPLELAGKIRPGLLLFAVPVVWWLVNVVRKRAEPAERHTFWWLAGCSFVPVAVVIAAGWLVNDSFWFDRYFIFVAPFYLALVAASVCRLRPATLRTAYAGALVAWAAIAGINDIATNRMAWTAPQIGSRVEWSEAARQLVTSTVADTTVYVYLMPVWSQDYWDGQWAVYQSMPFYMDSLQRERFRYRPVGGNDYLFREHLGSEFWITGWDIGTDASRVPEEKLRNLGYEVVQVLNAGKHKGRFQMYHVVRRDAAAGAPMEEAEKGDQP